jgi:hypothetical protein
VAYALGLPADGSHLISPAGRVQNVRPGPRPRPRLRPRPPFIGRLGEPLRLGLQPSARRPAASLRLPRDYGHRAAPCDPTALLLGRHEEDSHDAPACSSAGILYPC